MRRVVITERINPQPDIQILGPGEDVDYEKRHPPAWQATLDNYEPGQPIGHGPSEAFAVYDLFMLIEVHEEVSCSIR